MLIYSLAVVIITLNSKFSTLNFQLKESALYCF